MRQGHRCEASRRLENMDKRCYSPLQLPCEQVFEVFGFRMHCLSTVAPFLRCLRVCIWHCVLLVIREHRRHETHAFLMGKSRLAPLKVVTIPRLELTAAVVAVKVDKMLQQELLIPLQQSTFWTDSTTVLKYSDLASTWYKVEYGSTGRISC